MPHSIRTLLEPDAPPESFHDCYVRGLEWRTEGFGFSLYLQYVLEWIPPADGVSSYDLLVAEARLTFVDVDELRIALDWRPGFHGAQIESFVISGARATPAGTLLRYFELEFDNPAGNIRLWGTGYSVVLLSEPSEALEPGASRPAW